MVLSRDKTGGGGDWFIVIVVSSATGDYKKEELLEAARGGNEEKIMALLTPLNVNSHASDGRKVSSVYTRPDRRARY